MLVAIGLCLIAFILFYLDFFVPGGILGVIGGLAYLASVVLFIWEAGAFWPSIIFIMVTLVLVVFTIKFALWKMKQRPSFFAKEEQSGYLASEYDRELIGKEGEVVTDLKPSGHILVEGCQYQAVSESGYIKKGELVKLIGGEGARFIVRRS